MVIVNNHITLEIISFELIIYIMIFVYEHIKIRFTKPCNLENYIYNFYLKKMLA